MHAVADQAEYRQEQAEAGSRSHGTEDGQGGKTEINTGKVHTENAGSDNETAYGSTYGKQRGVQAVGKDQRKLSGRGGNDRTQASVVPLSGKDAAQSENTGVGTQQESIADHPACQVCGAETVGSDQAIENQCDQGITNLHQGEFLSLEGCAASFVVQVSLVKKTIDHQATSSVAAMRTRRSILRYSSADKSVYRTVRPIRIPSFCQKTAGSSTPHTAMRRSSTA